jgi:trk system potassium uptake protein TrkH
LRIIAGMLLPLISMLSILVLLYDFGFLHSDETRHLIELFYDVFLFMVFVLLLLRIDYFGLFRKTVRYTKTELSLFFLFILIWLVRYVFGFFISEDAPLHAFFHSPAVEIGMILFLFLAELSLGSLNMGRFSLNPALVFLLSFLIIIFIGALLLMLPNCSYTGVHFIDALFTSTSAVCVTGLIVVDTATHFTPLGQHVILILIQVGGLGILTFTSFFGMYLRTSSSFQNQLMIGDMMNEDKISDVFKNIVKVIAFTFVFEAVFAVFLYFTLDIRDFSSQAEMIRFAIFHSISAFCNAGFSLLSDGLYDISLRYNYVFLMLIAFLIIVGGLGFTIIFNSYTYLKHRIVRGFKHFFSREEVRYKSRIVSVHSKLVIITTFCLIMFGWILNFVLEYNNSLEEHNLTGKIVHAFFASVTPRTAGFNAVDMTTLLPATVLIYYLLMLIGGSPGSTAGGIKTTTFAIAAMNVISLARGKNRVEVFRRELSIGSLRRAFAVIALSTLFIGLAVFLVHVVQPGLDTTKVIFECISAFSTVGLSLGITYDLNVASKTILIITMFIGRIGTLTLFVAFFKKVRSLNYRYPTESILIS